MKLTDVKEFDENLIAYMNCMYSILEYLENPIMITCDDKQYMLAHNQNVYGVVDDELNTNAFIFNPDGTLINYIDNDDAYTFCDDGDLKIVSHQDCYNQVLEQLFYEYPKENKPRGTVCYYLGQPDNREISVVYDDVSPRHDIQVYMNYINQKTPTFVSMGAGSKALNKYYNFNDHFHRVWCEIFNYIKIYDRKVILTKDEMYDAVNEYLSYAGNLCFSGINQNMINLFNGADTKKAKLEKIIGAYKTIQKN